MISIIIFAALLILLILPVGVDIGYDGRFFVRLKIGPVSVRILPAPRKKAEKPKKLKPERKAVKKPRKQKKSQKLFTSDMLFPLIRLAIKALKRFRKKLSVDLFELKLTAGGGDPCAAAVMYGAMSAAAGALELMINNTLNVEERNISVSLDFNAETPKARFRLITVIQIYQILYIALALVCGFLSLKAKKTRGERIVKNGQQNERSNERHNDQNQRDGGRKHRRRQSHHNA